MVGQGNRLDRPVSGCAWAGRRAYQEGKWPALALVGSLSRWGGGESEVRRGEASSGGESKGFSALNAGYGRTGACLGVGAEDRSNESSRALSSAVLR